MNKRSAASTGSIEQIAGVGTQHNGSVAPVPVHDAGLQQTFDALVQRWRADTLFLSDLEEKVLHPAYQKIIDLGPPAIPLILQELQTRPGHWFSALKAITGEDAAPAERKFDAMAKAWLRWGRERGYIN